MVPFTSSRPGRFIWYKSLNVATEPVFVLNVAFNFTGPFLLPRCHIEGVQAMNKGSVLVCFGYHVQSTRIGIDDRSRYDAELRERGHAGAPLHRPWHCGDSCRRIDKTNLPKWLRVDARIVVCIKRINAVMLCGHIDHVMRSAARYGNIRQVQRLPHHDPVDTLRK